MEIPGGVFQKHKSCLHDKRLLIGIREAKYQVVRGKGGKAVR